jgi:hypothetical protein
MYAFGLKLTKWLEYTGTMLPDMTFTFRKCRIRGKWSGRKLGIDGIFL